MGVPGVVYAMIVLGFEDLDLACSVILSLLLPPLGVWWRFGCGLDVVVCLLLTLLFHLPGAVYAIAILAFKEPDVLAHAPTHQHRSHGDAGRCCGHRSAVALAEQRRLLQCDAALEAG